MPHEGMDHASRRTEKCITREEYFHHDGKKSASRGRKKGFLERKTMSCGAENYGLVFLTLHFLYIFHACSMGFRFFYTFAAKILTINF